MEYKEVEKMAREVAGYVADAVIKDEAGNLPPKPSSREVPLQKGEMVNVNGVWMKVLNFTENSVTVHPETPLILEFKGVPVYIHKIVNGDLVLRRFTKAQVARAQASPEI
jgi:hypothetical protein